MDREKLNDLLYRLIPLGAVIILLVFAALLSWAF